MLNFQDFENCRENSIEIWKWKEDPRRTSSDQQLQGK